MSKMYYLKSITRAFFQQPANVHTLRAIQVMNDKLNDLLDNPNHFLFHMDQEQAFFIEMNRSLFHRSIFLDSRIKTFSTQMQPVKLSLLVNQLESRESESPKNSYIFHMAHVGSTLLSRALDIPGQNVVYREPQILRHLGVMAASRKATAETNSNDQSLLKLVAHVLGRSYGSNQDVIVKANVPVNFIIGRLLDLQPESPAILLYSTLENYLLALMKSKDHQQWVLHIIKELAVGWEEVCGLSTNERNSLSLPQSIACIWFAQISIFKQAAERYPFARTLNSEVLFCHPRSTMDAALSLFQQQPTQELVKQIINSRTFTHHSKNPSMVFNNQLRIAQREKLKNSLSKELAEARSWLDQQQGRVARKRQKIGSMLPAPLVPAYPSELGV
jgi:hypothetical protein